MMALDPEAYRRDGYAILERFLSAQDCEALKARAAELAAGPILGIAMAKQVINRCWDSDPETALEFEAIAQTLCLVSEDHREAIRAAMENRKPRYRGR